jgi:hypothetical protein
MGKGVTKTYERETEMKTWDKAGKTNLGLKNIKIK